LLDRPGPSADSRLLAELWGQRFHVGVAGVVHHDVEPPERWRPLTRRRAQRYTSKSSIDDDRQFDLATDRAPSD